MVGGVVSTTETVKLQFDDNPATFVTEQVTVVFPSANVAGVAGLQTKDVAIMPTASVAAGVGVYAVTVYVAVALLVGVYVLLNGQVICMKIVNSQTE